MTLGSVSIAPRPLRPDPNITAIGATSYAENADGFVEVRQAQILRAGISVALDVTVGNCPPASLRFQGPLPSVCPTMPESRIAISLIRDGGAQLPGWREEKASDRQAGYKSCRVIIARLSPGGAATEAYDFVMLPEPTGWRLIAFVALSVSE